MAIRTRIGLLVPSTNATLEPDFYRVAPRDITAHAHRLWLTNESEGAGGMDRMNAEIETGAKYLATAKVKAIAYGCTAGSFYKGPGWDKEMLAIISKAAGVPAVGTSPSAAEALRHFKAKKVSVATPYPRWSNERLRIYLEAMGFQVLNVEGEPTASKAGPQGICDQDPEVILEFAAKVCKPEADALFCSCTAWRAVEVVDELERRVGRPVVTSNQATIWNALRAVGWSQPISGYGSLFRQLAPVAR